MTKIYSWLGCIALLPFQKFLGKDYFCAQIPLNKGFCSLNIPGFWTVFTEADKAKLKKHLVLQHASFNKYLSGVRVCVRTHARISPFRCSVCLYIVKSMQT